MQDDIRYEREIALEEIARLVEKHDLIEFLPEDADIEDKHIMEIALASLSPLWRVYGIDPAWLVGVVCTDVQATGGTQAFDAAHRFRSQVEWRYVMAHPGDDDVLHWLQRILMQRRAEKE